jgi:choline dehydrogenase-like flavoprotein
MRLLRRIMSRPALERYVAEERAPGLHCTSDADLLAFAREKGTTVFHPTSTCRMGSDLTAVVDERLQVHHTERLRVIDGSITPTVVSGNTNAAIAMIAEKGADMILQDAAASMPISVAHFPLVLNSPAALRGAPPGSALGELTWRRRRATPKPLTW